MCQNRSLLFHEEFAFEVLDALGGEVVTAGAGAGNLQVLLIPFKGSLIVFHLFVAIGDSGKGRDKVRIVAVCLFVVINGLFPIILAVLSKAILLMKSGHHRWIRLKHIRYLVKPRFHIPVKRKKTVRIHSCYRICKIYIAGINLPSGKEFFLSAIHNSCVPIALAEIVVDWIGVITEFLLTFKHFNCRNIFIL